VALESNDVGARGLRLFCERVTVVVLESEGCGVRE
jgi:hypothetical protein